MTSERFAAIVCDSTIRVYSIADIDRRAIVLDGCRFTNVSTAEAPEYSTGFYDWLRRRGVIIGLRYSWLSPDYDVPCFLRGRAYVQMGAAPAFFELFFGASRDYDEEDSCDQQFWGAALFRSGDERLLITARLPRAGDTFDCDVVGVIP